MKKRTNKLSLVLLIGIIMISGCTAKEPVETPENVYYILMNSGSLNGQSMALKGTVIEWCITNSAMWMDGSFSDKSGEIPVIFNTIDVHHCKDINFTKEYVEYKATIESTIIHKEMTDHVGNSVGMVTYLQINNITEQ